jgi:catechol 2,3-dioxygenase-like lactoylglutathione lyase family enzyme
MIRRLYLVELTVADWPAALAWYRDMLTLEIVQIDEAHRFALLRAGEWHLSLVEGRPEPGTVRLTFEVDDLSAELRRLAELGVVPESPLKVSSEGYRRALVRDPDGHRLDLFDWGV